MAVGSRSANTKPICPGLKHNLRLGTTPQDGSTNGSYRLGETKLEGAGETNGSYSLGQTVKLCSYIICSLQSHDYFALRIYSFSSLFLQSRLLHSL